jgi:hypothetical protein
MLLADSKNQDYSIHFADSGKSKLQADFGQNLPRKILNFRRFRQRIKLPEDGWASRKWEGLESDLYKEIGF